MQCKVSKDCIVLFISGNRRFLEEKFQIVKDSVGICLAVWNATKSWSVISVCDPEYEEFLGWRRESWVFERVRKPSQSQDLLLTQVTITSHQNLDLKV